MVGSGDPALQTDPATPMAAASLRPYDRTGPAIYFQFNTRRVK